MIVFVIAMDSEAKPLIDKMSVKKRQSVCGRTVVCGKLNGVKTAVVVCGIGKVNAAAGTQYAIDCLKATKIVNIGVAGGLNEDLKIGGIYCISEAVQYDFDLTEINNTPMGTLNEYDKPYLPLAVCRAYPVKRLASGDRFNDDKADYKLLTRTLEADIRDMEGGAIAHVCTHAKIPLYAFKAISDLAGKGSTPEQYKNNLEACAKALSENIEKIFGACL